MMSPEQVDQLRKLLLQQREELLEQNASAAESIKPVELDQASVGRLSRMDAMQMQAMALEQQRRRDAQLQRIDVALRHMGEDDYGLCIDCDQAIAVPRLNLNPTATRCIRCAAEQEKNA
ncbi:MAG: DnaK suppressor protein [Halieaceae bacterium]|jgi:DnaK suppressor protein